MNFLADEGVDSPRVVHLREQGFDVRYIAEFAGGQPDERVLEIANAENRILITTDKDFGELVYRLRQIHPGVILLRLAGLSPAEKGRLCENAIRTHSSELSDSFTVIQHRMIRIRKRQGEF